MKVISDESYNVTESDVKWKDKMFSKNFDLSFWIKCELEFLSNKTAMSHLWSLRWSCLLKALLQISQVNGLKMKQQK